MNGKLLFFESLGCPKNRVDSEVMISGLLECGWSITDSPEKADLIVLNTCSFINTAREESIARFFELNSIKKNGAKIAVTGCLPQLYPELAENLHEADFITGINDIPQLSGIINENWSSGFKSRIEKASFLYSSFNSRALSLSPFTAYLKIADGCNNCCSYCSIPVIRGEYRERAPEDIISEAQDLVFSGVKEIVIISQDTSRYGIHSGSSLKDLLLGLNSIPGDFRIRVMYLYPSGVDEDLLKKIYSLKKVLPYFEIPVQHVSSKVLKDMNRHYSKEAVLKLINNIKLIFGQKYALRTTFISSFPTEKKEDHEELKKFIEASHFDYSGVFKYSKEEFSNSAKLRVINSKTAQSRFDEIEKASHISMEKRLDRFIGMEMDILYEGIDPELKVPTGRGWHQAPEIDGITILTNLENQKPGSFLKCKLVSREGIDFIGEIV